ncbi:MAG: hypothetical protein MUO64_07425 [Anaerolineales bacterium]|nr:hypothetical protein [Anaerolineales bacterium]
MTGDSTPTVTVIPGGSLTVTPTGMSYGSRAAGINIPYTEGGGHKVAVTVSTNCTTWDVKCSSSPQVLTSGSDTIPSANFIYSSVRISGTPTNPITYGPLEFGSVGSPSNVVTTPATPAAADTLLVDVRYDLTIGSTQAAATGYTSTHTYTLTAS